MSEPLVMVPLINTTLTISGTATPTNTAPREGEVMRDADFVIPTIETAMGLPDERTVAQSDSGTMLGPPAIAPFTFAVAALVLVALGLYAFAKMR